MHVHLVFDSEDNYEDDLHVESECTTGDSQDDGVFEMISDYEDGQPLAEDVQLSGVHPDCEDGHSPAVEPDCALTPVCMTANHKIW